MVDTEEAGKTDEGPSSSSFRNPKQSAKTSGPETTVAPDGAARANTTCRISKAIEEGKEPGRAATLEFSVSYVPTYVESGSGYCARTSWEEETVQKEQQEVTVCQPRQLCACISH